MSTPGYGGYTQHRSNEAPACVQNAMLTKDKKPFTYTPGGIDLSQIKSERIAKRLARNALDEGAASGRPHHNTQIPSLTAESKATTNIGALATGVPFQVLPPPPPPPSLKFRGNPNSATAPTANIPPCLPGPIVELRDPKNRSKQPLATNHPTTTQCFEPPPIGLRPEIKIPPNPIAGLRKIAPPIEKNTFWKDEYIKERSKSPMVGECGHCQPEELSNKNEDLGTNIHRDEKVDKKNNAYGAQSSINYPHFDGKAGNVKREDSVTSLDSSNHLRNSNQNSVSNNNVFKSKPVSPKETKAYVQDSQKEDKTGHCVQQKTTPMHASQATPSLQQNIHKICPATNEFQKIPAEQGFYKGKQESLDHVPWRLKHNQKSEATPSNLGQNPIGSTYNSKQILSNEISNPIRVGEPHKSQFSPTAAAISIGQHKIQSLHQPGGWKTTQPEQHNQVDCAKLSCNKNQQKLNAPPLFHTQSSQIPTNTRWSNLYYPNQPSNFSEGINNQQATSAGLQNCSIPGQYLQTRERYIPIMLEKDQTALSPHQNSNAASTSYIIKSPNQFIDQCYNNFLQDHYPQGGAPLMTSRVHESGKQRNPPMISECSGSRHALTNDLQTPPFQSKSFRTLQKSVATPDAEGMIVGADNMRCHPTNPSFSGQLITTPKRNYSVPAQMTRFQIHQNQGLFNPMHNNFSHQ